MTVISKQRSLDSELVDIGADDIRQDPLGEHGFGGVEGERAGAMPNIEYKTAIVEIFDRGQNSPCSSMIGWADR